MHTILGANGVIARELSRALAAEAVAVRQVSRHPRPVNSNDQTLATDLLDADATAAAIAGSETVYLVAGLKYDIAVWQAQWPRVMQNVIAGCKHHGARLVFFDNVYAYGQVDGWISEQTPFNPCSRKGEVRARIARMLLDDMQRGDLQAMIVRAADFYGPGATNSFPHATVFQRLADHRAPQWIGNPQAVHTFTYTPDTGPAMALLAKSPQAWGQTWHLPSSREPLSGATFARLACELAGQSDKLQVAPRWMLKLMGLFMPVLRENEEMMYQFEHDYRFDSSKIETAFGLQATPYREGIAAALSSAIARRD